MQILNNKTLLLCVSASVAAFKACELVREFTKAGAKVKVLMSQNAKRFINPLSFEALSGEKVLLEESEDWAGGLNHVNITKDCDAVIFAPASANSINKLKNGIADNLLIATLLANTKPLIIAPAMNTHMWEHFSVQESVKVLSLFYTFVNPISKQLACKDVGLGALADVKDIFYTCAKEILKKDFWLDKKVIITGGGTFESIDDVRFVGNHSSGKMAYNLALALYLSGAKVKLITSMDVPFCPFELENFKTSAELKSKIDQNIKNATHLFMAAAVGDFVPCEKAHGKLKKQDLPEEFALKMRKNMDILASLKNENIIKIGFKAEMDAKNALQNAKKAKEDKNLHGIVLNILSQDVHFGSEQTRLSFISKNGVEEISLSDKLSASFSLLNLVEKI